MRASLLKDASEVYAEYGGCNVFGFLLAAENGEQDPPEWFCPTSDVGEATGLCTLGPIRYAAYLDPKVWEGGGVALTCIDHAERFRRVGGVQLMVAFNPYSAGAP